MSKPLALVFPPHSLARVSDDCYIDAGAPSLTTSLSNQRAGSLDDDGSRGGRRVRARRSESEAVPADSALNGSTLYGSASTVTDLRTLANSAHGSTLNGSGLSLRGAPESTHSHHHSQQLTNPGDSSNGYSFQPFHSASGNGSGSGFAKVPANSTGMHPDWISMAAAAGQQQVCAHFSLAPFCDQRMPSCLASPCGLHPGGNDALCAFLTRC